MTPSQLPWSLRTQQTAAAFYRAGYPIEEIADAIGIAPAECRELVEDLSLIGGARAIECELSALDRRRRRDRERRAACAAVPSWFSVDDLVPTAFEHAHRLV